MILRSLARLAEREGLLDDPAFERKPVDWVVNVMPDGTFLGLESLILPAEPGARRGPRRGAQVPVPRPLPGARRTGTSPDAGFLVENASFVCGLDLTAEQKYARRRGELERRQSSFWDLAREAAREVDTVGLKALMALAASPEQMGRLREAVAARAEQQELQSHHLIGFRRQGDGAPFVHLDRAVADYWTRRRRQAGATASPTQCLVTGRMADPVDKHPPIKKVPGGSASGVSLVSFNENAYESYGFKRNANAPVSRSAAEAYTTALNRLLDSRYPDPGDPKIALPDQHLRLSDDTVAVFWTDEPSLVPAAVVPAIGEADPDATALLGISLEIDESYTATHAPVEEETSTRPIQGAYEAPWRGMKPEDLESPESFRILILSGGQGRATVRAFHSCTVATAVAAMRQWFEDIRLDTLRRRPALYRLLSSLAVHGEVKNLPPNLAGEVFLAILDHRPLPRAVLEAAVRRARSEGFKDKPERMALAKAYLNRARRQLLEQQGIVYEEVRPQMNPNEKNQGYLLGRLFACMERMQELALGEVGASVTDRYFAAACATPQAVFPRLLKSEVHHYRKAREGAHGASARWLHGQIDRLCTWLVGARNALDEGESMDDLLKRLAGHPVQGFPGFLPLPEQGLFTLGYHQQRAEFFKKRATADS